MRFSLPVLRRLAGPLVIAMLAAIAVFTFNSFYRSRDEQVVEQIELFDRLHALTSEQRPQPANGGANPGLKDKFFHGGQTVEVVAANILTQLKQGASAEGIEIIRSGNLPLENRDGINWVSVNIEVSASESAIYKFIRDIETAVPALYIAKLQLRSNAVQGIAETVEAPLTVEVTVNGAIYSEQSG